MEQTLRIGNKKSNKAHLLHELFLTQTQIYKLNEKVENNMSTDKILSKAQINELIKGGSLGSILARFLSKLIKSALSLGKKNISPFGIKRSHVSQ